MITHCVAIIRSESFKSRCWGEFKFLQTKMVFTSVVFTKFNHV